jgi:multicomponent Na+:H+ antiporter subunit G
MSVLAIVMIVAGLFFLIVAAIGMLRLPDVFSRSHALSLTDSLGAFLVLAGLALYQGFSLNLLKIVMVLALMYLINPVVSHATIRAALRSGLKPWVREQP